jgi:hypothetical protein
VAVCCWRERQSAPAPDQAPVEGSSRSITLSLAETMLAAPRPPITSAPPPGSGVVEWKMRVGRTSGWPSWKVWACGWTVRVTSSSAGELLAPSQVIQIVAW